MSRPAGDTAEAHLRAALGASHALGAEMQQPGFPAAAFAALQRFQVARLERSYADQLARENRRGAARFFLEELYGGLNFLERDRQVEQVLPVMVRMLPRHMLAALADAFRLQALSVQLDVALCRHMPPGQPDWLDVRRYGEIYRTVPRAQREIQLTLIRDLGLELCQVVRHRLVLLLIRAMRGPAHAAGFGGLQGFLERGLSAFRATGAEGPEFIATIWERETRIMQRLYAADPDPFGFQNVQPK